MSRICVKNLPKYTTEDRLREFFSQKGEVTDAKLMRTPDGKSRQFGFIGYRTEQQAQEALNYFNKSFLDTSRIFCEVAWKEGNPNISHTWSRHSKGKEEKSKDKSNTVSAVPARKVKKRANENGGSDDPKLQEFLQVMQPRDQAKMWANDLLIPPPDKTRNDKPKIILADNVAQRDVDNLSKGRQPNKKQGEVVSDMDYFRSKVKKEWSDSDSESGYHDANGVGIEQGDEEIEDEDESSKGEGGHVSSQGIRHEEGVQQDVNQDNLSCPPRQDVFEEHNDAMTNHENLTPASEMLKTGRLFVRNLPYTATEDELAELFRNYGNVLEVHLVIDKETKRSKGFAYVCYKASEDAARALEELDHSIFQGRLLHVMPAKAKDPSANQDAIVSDKKAKTFKQQRETGRKVAEAGGNTQAWNSLFMRQDTVVENLIRKYKVSKSDLLDGEADDLAVRIALGETQIIAETKKALMNAGVNVSALEDFACGTTAGVERSNHVLLVKNLPFSSTEGELSQMFGKFGSLEKIILPPTKTLAMVIFLEPTEARAALKALAYKRYKDAPLYLEWAPSNILRQDMAPASKVSNNIAVGEQEAKNIKRKQEVLGMSEADVDPDRVESRSVFVKNLNFKTTDESLRKHLTVNMKEGKILSVKIKQHLKNGKNVSMGFGFIEMDSYETAASLCQDLQGSVLDGHALILQLCHSKKVERVPNKAENDRSSTKLIVRNVAFEATEKDLRELFSPFGQVKSLRLPTRIGKHRGFAFVDFVTKQEAQNARKALSNTHLYGRHLVLERAKEGETLEELRARTAAQFASDEVGIQNPTTISKKRKLTAFSD